MYVADIAGFYGVNESTDVTATVVYSSSGTLTMTIPDGISEADIIETVTESLVDALGIHASDVAVEVDMETGDVIFVVSSATYDEATELSYYLGDEDSIISAIEAGVPSSSVIDYSVSEEIEAVVELTIDASDASRDLTAATFQTEEYFSDFDGVVDVASNICVYVYLILQSEFFLLSGLYH